MSAVATDAMRYDIGKHGYAALQPGADLSWGALAPALGHLHSAALALRAAGWPPAFVFMLDLAWELVDKLWMPMEGILGEGCAMDPSVFCWIARQPDALNTGAAEGYSESSQSVGANFGLPHRDFTCDHSIRSRDGSPMMLSVWLPLNDVSAENGCIMVVPRSQDPHFLKRFEKAHPEDSRPAHMRPALPPGNGRLAMEVRFDLTAVRPLAPLKAGSLVAWVGNLIHWGTSCMPDAGAPPRCALGFNFLAMGAEPLQEGVPLLTRRDTRSPELAERLSLIATSLLAYSTWYSLSGGVLPHDFFA